MPVLILTAHGSEADKVRGLEALLRRPRSGQPQPEVYDDGSLQVNLGSREVSVDGAAIALTPTEYRLLAALIRHPGQTLAPDQLLELAWNDPLGIGPERVKFGVMRLRRKLGPGVAIEAVRGFGYRFVPPRV